MSPRFLTICLAVAALAVVTWACRDSEPVRRFWPGDMTSTPMLSALPPKPAGAASSNAANAHARPAGLRKCRNGSNVAYTDSTCPPGSREEAVAGGTLTVVPARRVPQEPAKPQNLLRTLSGSEPGDLQRKYIEREVGP